MPIYFSISSKTDTDTDYGNFLFLNILPKFLTVISWSSFDLSIKFNDSILSEKLSGFTILFLYSLSKSRYDNSGVKLVSDKISLTLNCFLS